MIQRYRTCILLFQGLQLSVMAVRVAFAFPFPSVRPAGTAPRHLAGRFHPGRVSDSRLCMSTETETRTLAPGSHVSEMEVKKSRFLGYATHVQTWEDASEYIQSIKLEHPKARHWCYGFQCGVNPVSERCSDDGEPAGTAGQPILGAIKSEELSNVVCVVVRYFGGVKLGAGGLIRAYGAAARQVLREAPVEVLIPTATVRVSVSSDNIGAVYESAGKVNGSTTGEEYAADGSLSVTISCKLEDVEQLKATLTDSTRGSAEFVEDRK